MVEVKTVRQFISAMVSRQAEAAYNAGRTMDMNDVRDELGGLEHHYRTDPTSFVALYGMPANLEDDVSCRH